MTRVMDRTVGLWALLLLASLLALTGPAREAAGGLLHALQGQGAPDEAALTERRAPVVAVPSDDAALGRAEAEARATLDGFLARRAQAGAGWRAVSMKIALRHDGLEEQVWVGDFQALGAGRFRGLLKGDPVSRPGLATGDLIYFERDEIVDWAFFEGGTGYGFYTLRALIPTMTEEQAAVVGAVLSPAPLPQDW